MGWGRRIEGRKIGVKKGDRGVSGAGGEERECG